MRRPAGLSKIVVAGILALVISAQSASASAGYRERDVVRAFSDAKIKLASTAAGNESQTVTALTAVVPTKVSHEKPWAVAVWVYDSTDVAAQAFNAGVPQWRANGIPSMRVGNIVVTVVPKGREIGAEAPPFPMPSLVRKALSALKNA
jgi:hypothetical protein